MAVGEEYFLQPGAVNETDTQDLERKPHHQRQNYSVVLLFLPTSVSAGRSTVQPAIPVHED